MQNWKTGLQLSSPFVVFACCVASLLATVWHEPSQPRFLSAHTGWVPAKRHNQGRLHSHRSCRNMTCLSWNCHWMCSAGLFHQMETRIRMTICNTFSFVSSSLYFSGAGIGFCWKQPQLLREWFSQQIVEPCKVPWNWGLSRLALRSFR